MPTAVVREAEGQVGTWVAPQAWARGLGISRLGARYQVKKPTKIAPTVRDHLQSHRELYLLEEYKPVSTVGVHSWPSVFELFV